MKTFIYLLLLIIPVLTFSQDTENEKVSFKKKDRLFLGYAAAGFNLNQIDGDRSAGYNNIGANVGIGAFITYSKKFSNSLEISYSMKGAKSSFNYRKSHPGYFSYQMDYIEIPLLFNYHDFKVAIFHIGASYSNTIRTKFMIQQSNVLIPYHTWNLDMVVGFTFLIKEHWGLNFKYNYSMLNNLKNGSNRGNLISQPAKNSSSTNGILNWYHNTLTFRAMYIF